MDLFKIAIKTIKKNLTLFLILMISSISVSVVHYFVQSYSHISNFKTSNGFVDYTLFKSLTDFKIVSTDVYDLPEDEVETIVTALENFKVSFIEETTSSISFTAVSDDESADHTILQNYVLKLINNNRFIKNAKIKELTVIGKKLLFLKEKIRQLDSLMQAPSENAHMSGIPSDAYYLYSQQLDLEGRNASMGNFEIIKPVTEILTNKKPVILFIALYIVLASFVFLIFSKKLQEEV